MDERKQQVENLRAIQKNLQTFASKSIDEHVQKTFQEALVVTEEMIDQLTNQVSE